MIILIDTRWHMQIIVIDALLHMVMTASVRSNKFKTFIIAHITDALTLVYLQSTTVSPYGQYENIVGILSLNICLLSYV